MLGEAEADSSILKRVLELMKSKSVHVVFR